MRRRRIPLLLLLVLGAPFLLEANARLQTGCPTPTAPSPCATDLPPTTSEALWRRAMLLSELADKRRDGEETLADAEATARALVVWVSDPGWPHNGVACPAAVFIKVRDDLPAWAERYVLLHEVEHLMAPERSETEVNFIAARRAPVGMALTVAVSVARRLTGEGSLGCRLASLWRTFQTYFLDRP